MLIQRGQVMSLFSTVKDWLGGRKTVSALAVATALGAAYASVATVTQQMARMELQKKKRSGYQQKSQRILHK